MENKILIKMPFLCSPHYHVGNKQYNFYIYKQTNLTHTKNKPRWGFLCSGTCNSLVLVTRQIRTIKFENKSLERAVLLISEHCDLCIYPWCVGLLDYLTGSGIFSLMLVSNG